MAGQALEFAQVLNRLRRGTLEGRLLWERTGGYGQQYAAPLDNGHRAAVACTPSGSAVVFTMTNAQGVQTILLDSSRVGDDVVRLGLLQLFVAVRDTLAHQVTAEALDAVKDL